MDFGDMKIKPTYMIFFQDLHYRIDNQNCFETSKVTQQPDPLLPCQIFLAM